MYFVKLQPTLQHLRNFAVKPCNDYLYAFTLQPYGVIARLSADGDVSPNAELSGRQTRLRQGG